jgi:uncharacterized protein
MIPRIVVDTNILVSAAITRRGAPAAVLDSVANSAAIMCISESVLAEYEAVLLRLRLRLDPVRVRLLLETIRQTGRSVEPLRTIQESPDDSDNRFLECAEAAAADFLVTGNLKHFPVRYRGTRIVTARQFLAELT